MSQIYSRLGQTGPFRVIALECVQGGGAWTFGDRYLAVRIHKTPHTTWFDVMNNGELRTLEDTRFVPCNADHWPLFSPAHRLKFGPRRYFPLFGKSTGCLPVLDLAACANEVAA